VAVCFLTNAARAFVPLCVRKYALRFAAIARANTFRAFAALAFCAAENTASDEAVPGETACVAAMPTAVATVITAAPQRALI
jgi:hypothetical protein